MRKSLLLILALLCASLQAQTRYVGGDISMLPRYEQLNSPYQDAYGSTIDNLLLWFMQDCGWNTFRVRIFVNPDGTDPAVCQTTDYVKALGKRIKDAGAYFMLDFHYSDTWVDASHIQAPAAWQSASAAAKADSIGAYTRRVLTALNAAGATPDLVQVGNEIMYGLCGIAVKPYSHNSTDANWPSYINLLKAGCNAVREVCPQAQIIIHTDRPNETTNTCYYYDKLINGGVDFDIIGLSYYPFWHGYLLESQGSSSLVKSLGIYAARFPDKLVQIVETAYNFQHWPESGVNYNTQSIWACSVKGQYQFVKDLVDAVRPIENLNGLCYWFPEEAGNGDKGTVLSGWLNRGFWNLGQTTTSHPINKTGNPVAGFVLPEKVCAPYYMGKYAEIPEGISSPAAGRTAVKTLENGRLVIRTADRRFDVLGQEL